MADHVWREGSRIRRADGTGYADTVPGDTIWDHISNAIEDRDRDFIGFAIAVLDLRSTEADEAALARLEEQARASEGGRDERA